MPQKKKLVSLSDLPALVYSTDPNYRPLNHTADEVPTLAPAQQRLKLWLETKHRGGKAVTVIRDFVGSDEDLQQLGKQLKQACGTGGSAKDAEILIQGDHRDKLLQWLHKNGYTLSKKAGG